MGQNQSILEGSEVIVIDESLHILGSRKCHDSTVSGHTRPLPPPPSRETVICELRSLYLNKAASSCSEIPPLSSTKRTIDSFQKDKVKAISERIEDDTKPRTTERSIQSAVPRVRPATVATHEVEPPRKKKRLFTNEEAVKVAQQISERPVKLEDEVLESGQPGSGAHAAVPSGDGIVHVDDSEIVVDGTRSNYIKRKGPFDEDESEDEGYFTYSPRSADTSINENDEESLAKTLAELHPRSVSNRLDPAEYQTLTPPDSPALRKIKEEDDSAEQSRKLRELKLSGKRFSRFDDDHSGLAADLLEGQSLLGNDEPNKTHVVNSSLSRFKDSDTDDDTPFSNYQDEGRNSRRVPTYKNGRRKPLENRALSDLGDSDEEHALDVAQSYANRTMSSPKFRKRKVNTRTPQYRPFPNAPNPYSRQAADRYRTQNRHLDESASPKRSEQITPKGADDGEARLRAFTSKTHEANTVIRPPASILRSHSPLQQQRPKFHAIDLSGTTPIRRARVMSPDGIDAGSIEVEDQPGISQPRSNTVSFDEDVDLADETPDRPLSGLEMLAKKAQAVEKRASTFTQSRAVDNPEVGVIANIDFEDEQQVKDEHERLKDQLRDLQAIDTTGIEIARLRSLGPLHAAEVKEEREVLKFVNIVLGRSLSGKYTRPRIQKIRANMTYRLMKESAVATDDEVEEELVKLLGKDQRDLLKRALDSLEDAIAEMKTRRQKVIMKRHNAKDNPKTHANHKANGYYKSKKQVRFANALDATGKVRRDLADGTVIDLDGPKKKARPLGKEAREAIRLRKALALFETPISNAPPASHTSSRAQDSESDVSEEDEGAEYVLGAGRTSTANSSFTASTNDLYRNRQQDLGVEQDLDEIARLETERQARDNTLAASRSSNALQLQRAMGGGQRPDLELIERMKQSQISRQQIIDAELPFDDLAEVFDSSDVSVASTASTSSTDSSSDDDEGYLIDKFRYQILGEFAGVGTYSQKEEYRFERFHSEAIANTKLRSMVSNIEDNCRLPGEFCHTQVVKNKGRIEGSVQLGDCRLEARFWIEKQTVTVDTRKLKLSKAKMAKLREVRRHWAVDWEKTVTETVTVEATSTPPAQTASPTANAVLVEVEDEDDDLFGPSPPPPAFPPPQPEPVSTTTKELITKTTPTTTEILGNQFTKVSHANITARNVYMAWYAQFFPAHERPFWGKIVPASGNPYEGTLGQVYAGTDEDLIRWSDEYEGVWEMEVDLTDGVTGIGRKEKMRVWVREVGVRGPQNY